MDRVKIEISSLCYSFFYQYSTLKIRHHYDQTTLQINIINKKTKFYIHFRLFWNYFCIYFLTSKNPKARNVSLYVVKSRTERASCLLAPRSIKSGECLKIGCCHDDRQSLPFPTLSHLPMTHLSALSNNEQQNSKLLLCRAFIARSFTA